MSKSNYIETKSFKTFFIASVLTSTIVQINLLADGIIVSNLVSPDAFSVQGLANPLLVTLYMFASAISYGASVIVAKDMGMQNYARIAKTFTTSVIVVVASTCLLAGCLMLCSGSISSLLTHEQRLLPYLQAYLPVTIAGSIVVAIQTICLMYVRVTGSPRLATLSVLVEGITNVIMDVILIKGCSMGIAGAAWATNISVVFSILFLLPYLFGKNSLLKWTAPETTWFSKLSRTMVLNGMPTAIGYIAVAIFLGTLNSIILHVMGADGMFIIAVMLQIIMTLLLVLGGAGNALTTIGGVLFGEGDIDCYRRFVSNILCKALIILAVISGLLTAFPDVLPSLFGATGTLLESSKLPMRMLAVSLTPMSIIILMTNTFLVQGHKVLSTILHASFVVNIPLLFVTAAYFPNHIWHVLSFGFWGILACMLCITFAISQRDKTLHWFTLISKLPNDPNLSLEVSYDSQSVQKALEQTHIFLQVCDLSHELHYRIDSCIEELATNIIFMTQHTHKKGYFELRVVDDGKKILVVMKHDGPPFNPILKYSEDVSKSVEDRNLSLAMICGLCPDINYNFLNGINCTYLNFRYAD